ncbi:MAG: protein kinase [Ignavibacteriales bacterium]|nr:protein kinase [Ignavibacteriales bacterium]
MIGKTISHYKILEKLGEGGMGVVYKAQDISLDRMVALKFLAHHLIANESDKARFIHEAKAAAILNHPNICTIHGIEEDEGETFIVMEFIDGRTLKEVIPTLTYKQSLDIAIQIAKGLSTAHEHGIIHRDIKPENIMVRRDGIVVIMDFGLAKLRGASKLTQAGLTAGTAGYMAPEQILGHESDHKADIFSLGVVLYELMSGQLPFKGMHSSALMYEIVNVEAPSVSTIKPEINTELDLLIQECLVKEPNDRIQSVAEVRRKLESISASSKKTKTKTGHQKVITSRKSEESKRYKADYNKIKQRAVILLGLFGFFTICTLILLYLILSQPEPLDLSKYKYTPLATDPEPEGSPAWSRDGKSIAYTKVVNGYSQIFVRNLSKPIPYQITNLDKKSASSPFWSPNGNLIYFISTEKLYSVGLAGGEPKKIIESVSAATISPDSKTIAYWSWDVVKSKDANKPDKYSASVYITPANGGERRKYMPAPFEVSGGYVPKYINFSPDGKKNGLSTYSQDAKDVGFWILPWPDGNDVKPFKIFHNNKDFTPQPFSWMPDSRNLVSSSYRGNGLFIGDTETNEIKNITKEIPGGNYSCDVSPDGNRIALAIGRSDFNIIRIPLDGSEPELFIASSRNESSISYSDNGNKSIYITNRNGEDEIWLRKNEEDVRPLIGKQDFPEAERFTIAYANLSPDGTRLAFRIHDNSGFRIYVVSTEGGKPTRLNAELITSWSPDSKCLVTLDPGGLAIVKVGDPEGKFILPNTKDFAGWVYWSPDGKWIYYRQSGRENLILVSTDGKTKKVIPIPGINVVGLVVWPKGGSILYGVTQRSLCSIDIN